MFILSCENGNLEAIKYFISLGCDMNAKDKNHGTTGFHFACLKGHLDVLKYLISLECNHKFMNEKSQNGMTSLMYASYFLSNCAY
jgi:ankyrin repeat protein